MSLKSLCKVGVLAIIILSSLILYHQIPIYSGTIEIEREGYNNVRIERNDYGIPFIESENFEDIAYGIGYVHAQDRLWSIQFKRRVSQGRLAEIVGDQALRTDILFRELKLDRSAKKKYENSSPRTKKVLQAYANGINDYVNNLKTLPLEFQIMFDNFEPYLPHHSFSLINLMSFFLTLDMVYEPFRQILLEKYGEELALKLMGSRTEFNFEMTTIMSDNDLKKMGLFENRTENAFPKDTSFKLSQEYMSKIVTDDIVNMLDGVIKGIKGSNSWVVHGNYTKSGKPLLANDPHLETMIPSIWYQAEYSWKKDGKVQKAIGATLPGLPFIMIGRTDYASWGITNDIIDNSDYYVEQIKNHTYLFNNQWHPLKETHESIKVRFGETFNFTLQETHHGPIIKGLFHLMDVKNYVEMEYPVSLCWTGHIENDGVMDGLLDLLYAKSVDEIEDAFHIITAPTLNLVYATVDNHIGYYAQGKLPIKPIPGSNHFQNGTDPQNDWIGYYAKEEQPRIRDPEKGFIVTANNKISSDNLIHNINKAQNSIPRARRITDILSAQIKEGRKFSVEDFQRMQKDVLDVYASYMVNPIIQIFLMRGQQYLSDEKFTKYQQLIEHLFNWDYRMTKESIGASIYISWEHYFLRSYLHEVSENEDIRIILNMSYMFDHFFMNEIKSMAEIIKKPNQSYNKSYCIIKGSNNEGDCIRNVIIAFEEAFEYLTEKYGSETSNWQWGLIHRHRFDHKPFSQTPLKYFFERSYVGEGNRRTINVGGVNHLPNNWDSWYSANYRQVIDMSENNDSYFVLDTGISENIFSEHYDDQMSLHQKGQQISMKFNSQKKNYQPKHVLNILFKNNNKNNNNSQEQQVNL